MYAPVAEQLRLSDFDFQLPEALIAQEPCAKRDGSRLMAMDRSTGVVAHRSFADLQTLLVSGDMLVLNDTKVYPCRLAAKKAGGGKAEIFLIAEQGRNRWDDLVKGVSGIGKRLTLECGIDAELTEERSEGAWLVHFHGSDDIKPLLHEIGKVPLPPYIKHEPTDVDCERYQTVYASREGAVAAPTAGLHFTRELLANLDASGIEFVRITLHVGPGTFQPVRALNIVEHRMLPERYEISEDAAYRINQAKNAGRRVLAVGTTSMRTIETAAATSGSVRSGSGSSELFIYPGYPFAVADGLITNFHLPKSTLLMLVSAFAGRERILSAYQAAVAARYRFYSYGDAMMIL